MKWIRRLGNRWRTDNFMSAAAISAIRELLVAQDVPLAAFIDDHVRNAIVERNLARDEVEKLEAEIAALAAPCQIDGCQYSTSPERDDA